MFTATVAVSILLAALLSASVAMKLSHKPAVVENYAKAGVPEERLNSSPPSWARASPD